VKIELWHIGYTVAMILLAFVVALLVTKTIGRYISKSKETEEES